MFVGSLWFVEQEQEGLGLLVAFSPVCHQISSSGLHGILSVQAPVWPVPLGGGGVVVLDVLREDWEE